MPAGVEEVTAIALLQHVLGKDMFYTTIGIGARSLGGSFCLRVLRGAEKGLSGLSQNNNFWEHFIIKQTKPKLVILCGAKVSGNFGFEMPPK